MSQYPLAQNELEIRSDADIIFSGQEDMNVESMWGRMGISVDNPRQYHL